VLNQGYLIVEKKQGPQQEHCGSAIKEASFEREVLVSVSVMWWTPAVCLSVLLCLTLVVFIRVCDCDAADEGSKSVCLPAFDDSREGFHMWWTRLIACAMFYKFSQCLKAAQEKHLPSSEAEGANYTQNEKDARKRNALAMYNFTLAFQTEGLMSLIHKAATRTWPGGKAHVVVASLMKEFMPDDVMTHVELRSALWGVKLKGKREDPSRLFEQLSTITNKYQHTTAAIVDNELLAVIMDKAPAEYKRVITSEQRSKGTNLSLDDLEEAIHQHWQLTGGKGDQSHDSVLPQSGGRAHFQELS
jgi:hypothetical protein